MPVKLNPFGAVSFTLNRSKFHGDLAREIRRFDGLEKNHRVWVEMVVEDLAGKLLKLAMKYCPVDSGTLQLSGKVVKQKTRSGYPRFQIVFSTKYAGIVHDFWLPPLGGYPWAADIGKYGKNRNPNAKRFFLEQAAEEMSGKIAKELRKAVDYAQRNAK